MNQTEFSGALEVILQRNAFYYQAYRQSIMCFFLLILLISALIALNIVFYQDKPRPIYFATTATGEILDLPPISKKNISDEQLIRWVNDAMGVAYNYNFINYRQAIQNARPYFTVRGHNNFLKALQQSLNLNSVKTEKALFASIISDVIIEKQGRLASGTYYWEVKVPMKIGLLGGVTSKYIGYNWIVNLTIIRMNPLQNPSGLGIAQMVVTEL